MKIKIATLTMIFVLFSSLFFGFFYLYNFDNDVDRQWTKALCDGNVCRDYLISCNDANVVSMRPISGLVTLDENWVDTRNSKLC
jgi:hypothetical protein